MTLPNMEQPDGEVWAGENPGSMTEGFASYVIDKKNVLRELTGGEVTAIVRVVDEKFGPKDISLSHVEAVETDEHGRLRYFLDRHRKLVVGGFTLAIAIGGLAEMHLRSHKK